MVYFKCLFCFQAAEGARIAGASRIIGVDLNSSRFELGQILSIHFPKEIVNLIFFFFSWLVVSIAGFLNCNFVVGS
jgi:hypothetical protein